MTTTHPRRLQDVPWKSLGGKDEEEGMLLHLKSGDYFTVNGVGLRIWELADGSRSEERIAADLARRFEVSADAALQDVRSYCRSLEKAGLMDRGPKPANKPVPRKRG